MLVRGHEQDRIEAMEYVRAICFYASVGYHKEGARIEDIFSLPGDRSKNEVDEEERARTIELMNQVTEAYKKKYNLQ